MHERPYWWRPDDRPGNDWRYGGDRYQDSGRRFPDDDEERVDGPRRADDGRDNDDRRDWSDKAGDEVRTWFGDRRAARRREIDHERMRHRDHDGREDFRGVGPRMRHDEDEELRDEIAARLADDSRLDASDILVRVIDNEAILDGAVDSERDAHRAHDIALDVPGIVHVRDRLNTHRRGRDSIRRATIGMGYDTSRRRWRT